MKAAASSSSEAMARVVDADPRPPASRRASVLAKTATIAIMPVVIAVPSAMTTVAATPARKRPCDSAKDQHDERAGTGPGSSRQNDARQFAPFLDAVYFVWRRQMDMVTGEVGRIWRAALIEIDHREQLAGLAPAHHRTEQSDQSETGDLDDVGHAVHRCGSGTQCKGENAGETDGDNRLQQCRRQRLVELRLQRQYHVAEL